MLSSPDKEEYAFELLYQKYNKAIYGNVIRSVRNEAEVEDIVQDVFLMLWNCRKSLDPQKSVSGWLFSVSYHKTIDFLRKKIREKKYQQSIPTDENEAEEIASHEWNGQEELKYKVLENAIAALSPQKKRVFELCKLQGLSYEQAAEKMGISKNTIHEYLKDAMQFIRQYVTEHPSAVSSAFELGLLLLLLQ